MTGERHLFSDFRCWPGPSSGHYSRTSQLGDGIVWKVTDKKTKQTMALKKVFDDYDQDKCGSIDIHEFRSTLVKRQERLVAYNGVKKSLAERKAGEGVQLVDVLEPLFEAMDRDGDSAVTFAELLHVIYPLANDRDREIMNGWVAAATPPPPPPPKVVLSQEQLDEIREIFNLYDRDRSGSLTVDELSKALASCGMDADEIAQMFGESDENSDGLISFDEFAKLMSSTGLFGTEE